MRVVLFCAVVVLCTLADNASAVAGNGGVERRLSKKSSSGSSRGAHGRTGDRDLRGKATATAAARGQSKRQGDGVCKEDGGGSIRKRGSPAVVVGAVWEEVRLEVGELGHCSYTPIPVCLYVRNARSSCSRRSLNPGAPLDLCILVNIHNIRIAV